MRVLGFPKPISLESFRTPNWELMEECLRWLASRVEPDSALPRAGSVEQRVALVSQAIALFVSIWSVHLIRSTFYLLMLTFDPVVFHRFKTHAHTHVLKKPFEGCHPNTSSHSRSITRQLDPFRVICMKLFSCNLYYYLFSAAMQTYQHRNGIGSPREKHSVSFQCRPAPQMVMGNSTFTLSQR